LNQEFLLRNRTEPRVPSSAPCRSKFPYSEPWRSKSLLFGILLIRRLHFLKHIHYRDTPIEDLRLWNRID
jgi:hypothetical protein